MIGLGIITCDRPEYLEQVLEGVAEHLGMVDVLTVQHDTRREGVAVMKNRALRTLLDEGCDWLFLSEDDVVVQAPEAVSGYIAACEASGYRHLMFHGHGPHNVGRNTDVQGLVTLWPEYVGAWTVYHRSALEECGLMDEGFHNAWEHVEHTLRLSLAGFTAPWRGAADATGSEAWVREIPGSIEASVIREDPRWLSQQLAGRAHWLETHPETYRLLWQV